MANVQWNCIFSLIIIVLLPSGAAVAQNPESSNGKIYRLTADASYQQTCFEPCACPPGELQNVFGAFVLGPGTPGNVVDFHRVSGIYWSVGEPLDTTHSITGGGTYRLTNYGPPQSHALELNLAIDGGEPQLFFSDFVPADNGALSLDIPVSLNGMYCEDTVIRVSATPADDTVRYRLTPDSTYQQGCFDPCDCKLENPRPMTGAFDLVPLLDAGTIAAYQVARATFVVPQGDHQRRIRFAGFGQYVLVQGFAGPADIMQLQLRSGRLVTAFDSPLQNTNVMFPSIAVTVDMNDGVCFDKVLNIRAQPW